MARNVMQGERGITWKGNPVDIGKPFKVIKERGDRHFSFMVPVTVHVTDRKGKTTTHRRNVPVEELTRGESDET